MAAAATGCARTMALLWAQRDDARAGALCDVRVGGLYAHSFVLAAASPVAAAAFAAREDPAALTVASTRVQRALLALAYGVANPTDGLRGREMVELAKLCAALRMSAAALATVDIALAAALLAPDAVDALRASSELHLPRAAAACRALLKARLRAVAAAPGWPELPAARVAAALRVHDLMPRAEEDVFRALEAWFAHDVDARKPDAPALLRLIRFPTMSDRSLLRVARSPYFAGNDEFYRLLLEAFIRRAEVRLVHVPRIAAGDAEPRAKGAQNPPQWRRANVTDNSLGDVVERSVNLRDQRSVLFEGMFPLKWYKNMRFRTRSSASMLFTFVVTRWSTRKRRVCSESRSFADHRWSLWVDPYMSAAAAAAGDEKARHTPSEKDYISLFLCCEAEHSDAPGDPWPAAGEEEEGEGKSLGSAPLSGNTDPATGMASATGGPQMDMRVDYALFLVSANEAFGMERKVCTGRSFTFNGQAMGFRRHTRRSRITEAGFYDAERDELVVGAHVILPGALDAGVERPDVEARALAVSDASKRSSASRSSMDSWPRHNRPPAPTNDDLLRDLPPAALLHPAFAAYARRAHDPLVRDTPEHASPAR